MAFKIKVNGVRLVGQALLGRYHHVKAVGRGGVIGQGGAVRGASSHGRSWPLYPPPGPSYSGNGKRGGR